MKLLTTVLCLLGLNGCAFLPAREPTVTLHADKAFNGPERQCIKESADQWRSQTQGLADANVVYDYDPTNVDQVLKFQLKDRLVKWDSSMPLVRAEDEGDALLLGQVWPKGGIHNDWKIPVEMRLVSDRLTDLHKCKLTAVHELGHVFGVPHIPSDPGNIMFPSVIPTRTACLKNEDLLVFCMVNDCGRVEMKPCPDQSLEELGVRFTEE
jgi:hypothetical protein